MIRKQEREQERGAGAQHRQQPHGPRRRGHRYRVGSLVVIGPRRRGFGDLYYLLLTVRWPVLLLLIAAAFVAANLLFAVAYLLAGGIEHARPGSFADVFFFSVETMATIGYGKLSPTTLTANVLMTAEALFGLVGLAVVTGLLFAKFSRPQARVRFSSRAVVAKRNGVPCLMFRMANRRGNQIAEAQAHVALACNEETAEGERVRRFYELTLDRWRSVLFALSWTVVHPIDAHSPLHGKDSEYLASVRGELVVTVAGLDEDYGQTIHARHVYSASDIVWGGRFADIFVEGSDGVFFLDYSRFDDLAEE